MRPGIAFLTLFIMLPTSEAATVFRCTNEAGKITFSQYGCTPNQHQNIQEAFNPSPGTGTPVPMAKVKPASGPATRPKGGHGKSNEVVVVGEHQNECGNRVVGGERRKSIIEGRIKAGMTRSDVESALGRPDTISQQNGSTHFHYKADKQRGRGARTVSFDEDGCVIGKKKR